MKKDANKNASLENLHSYRFTRRGVVSFFATLAATSILGSAINPDEALCASGVPDASAEEIPSNSLMANSSRNNSVDFASLSW